MTILLVLGFFALFITLDYVMTRRRLAREATARALSTMPPPEPAWVAGYLMPEDRHYHRGHTWARPIDADTVLVGLDDFARRLTGPITALELPTVGDWLHQGGSGFAVKQDGRSAELVSPVEGGVGEGNAEGVRRP